MQPLVLLPALLLVGLGSAFQGRRQVPARRCTRTPTARSRSVLTSPRRSPADEREKLPLPRVCLHRVSHHTGPKLRRTSTHFMANDDDIDAEVSTDSIGEPRPQRLVECSAAIVLPFSKDVAFEAFSDLSRQPSWCSYLGAVEYVGVAAECSVDDEECVPLRSSRWTVAVR